MDIIWDHLPLTVKYESSGWDESITSAMAFWNDQVGIDLFKTPSSEDVDVELVFSPGSSSHAGASWHTRNVDGTFEGHIEIYRLGDSIEMKFLVAHEMGHILSLAHDAWDTSIMYPYLGEGMMTDYEGIIIVTGNDKKALRERY